MSQRLAKPFQAIGTGTDGTEVSKALSIDSASPASRKTGTYPLEPLNEEIGRQKLMF